jgi:hypothetical protein
MPVDVWFKARRGQIVKVAEKAGQPSEALLAARRRKSKQLDPIARGDDHSFVNAGMVDELVQRLGKPRFAERELFSKLNRRRFVT